MFVIICLVICIISCVFCVFCGYITKTINESKGYSGGFWLGTLLQVLGILIVSQKAEQPNAKENAFKVVLLKNVLKKYRYPFAPPQFEPIAMLKGEIDAEAKAAGLNLTFMLIHGLFMLCWYVVILGAYIWYIMGYTVWWLFKSQSKKTVDYAKSDAAEKVSLTKEKARATFTELKDKAATFASEHKKSSDEKIPVADEYDTEENYNKSSNEAVYQSDEEYAYKARDSIADDDTSYKRRINTNAQPAPMSSSPVYNARTYAYEKEKKSEIIYHILIGIISVLLVVIGVLFGILLMKIKSTTQTTNSNVSDATIEPYVQENTTKETIATTKPEKPTVSSDEINNAAKQSLSDFMKNNAVQSPKYSLYDVNGDSISELFITYMAISGDSNYILYYYNASKFSESEQFWGGLSICPDNHYLKETNYGGAEVYKYYQLNEENQLSKFDEIYSSPDGKYYRNGQEISNSEYYAAIYYYNDMSWIDIYDNSYSFSDLIDISAYVQNNTDSSDPYADIKQEILNSVDNEDYRGKNSHIENAPSDMVFYNYENRSSLSITNLTIYEGPDTNYPQISAYVSDAYIVGENNNWYYVQWYEGTGRFSHLCYGYLSKTGQSKKYTTYDTSAAGSDFSFNLDAYSRKVITEKDPLNLRAAPSTSADIIIQMPKGSDILLWGVNAICVYLREKIRKR